MKYILYFMGKVPQVEGEEDLKEWKRWLNERGDNGSQIGEEVDEAQMREELNGYQVIKAD